MKWIQYVDPFVALLFATVGVATLLPCRGTSALFFDMVADAAIVLLFFLHGAKLSRESIVSGLLHWKLHMTTLAVTFLVFPILGIAIAHLPGLEPALASGMLYLTLLPSTVQSSIAFTSIANGNVSAAVCAATLSNLLGMFLTPMLVAMLMTVDGQSASVSLDAVAKIGLQLLLPFIVGHLMRPVLGAWVGKHKQLVGRVDRSSILLVVYTAFSAAVIDGLWGKCSLASLAILGTFSLILLGFVLLLCWWLGTAIGLKREDRVVLLFCGSKKSLASGVPMAGVLFSASQVGLILLPVMLFHQIQLVICAIIARKLSVEKVSHAG
jgi:sodium/bile acid cotransporter 7